MGISERGRLERNQCLCWSQFDHIESTSKSQLLNLNDFGIHEETWHQRHALSLRCSISLFCKTLVNASDSHRDQIWKTHMEMRVYRLKIRKRSHEKLCFDICQMFTKQSTLIWHLWIVKGNSRSKWGMDNPKHELM